jgi:hypothetical protein
MAHQNIGEAGSIDEETGEFIPATGGPNPFYMFLFLLFCFAAGTAIVSSIIYGISWLIQNINL